MKYIACWIIMNNYVCLLLNFFFLCALIPTAPNTRVVWAWTWASRSARATTRKPRRHVAAELHTVHTHCPPALASVSLTRTHTRTHVKVADSMSLSVFGMLCRSIHSSIFSSHCQVLPITSSTARRGSKSLRLRATLAPCWGQTEVMISLLKTLFNYLNTQKKENPCKISFNLFSPALRPVLILSRLLSFRINALWSCNLNYNQ